MSVLDCHPQRGTDPVATPMANLMEEEWLWGWDPTPGIVSVWAEPDGRAFVWRRLPDTGGLVREDVRFRPWLLLSSLDDLAHLGPRLVSEREGPAPGRVTWEELEGPGALRFLARAEDGRALTAAVLHGASRRLGRFFGHLRDLDANTALSLPPEEQYLSASDAFLENMRGRMEARLSTLRRGELLVTEPLQPAVIVDPVGVLPAGQVDRRPARVVQLRRPVVPVGAVQLRERAEGREVVDRRSHPLAVCRVGGGPLRAAGRRVQQLECLRLGPPDGVAVDPLEVDHHPAEVAGGELHLEHLRTLRDQGQLLAQQLLEPDGLGPLPQVAEGLAPDPEAGPARSVAALDPFQLPDQLQEVLRLGPHVGH